MKFRVSFRSFNNDLIILSSDKLRSVLEKADCQITGGISLPLRIKRFCVLRSPHIDKDSREHFEVRTYKRFIDITTTSLSILDYLFKIELPAGVTCSLKIIENKL